jgi:putative intracellular protease/amidase
VAELYLWPLIKGIKSALFTADHGKGHWYQRQTMTQNKTMSEDNLRFHEVAKGDSVQALTQRQEPRVVDHTGYLNGVSCALDARQGPQNRDDPSQKDSPMNTLLALTSQDQLGDTGKKAGLWLEKLAEPHTVFKDAGVKGMLALPKHGRPPLDPRNDEPDAPTDATRRLKTDADTERALARTGKLSGVDVADYGAASYPGEHSPLRDLAQDPHSLQPIQQMQKAGKTVVAGCHEPAVLWRAKGADGASVVEGKRVTGSANSEKEDAGPIQRMPVQVKGMLAKNGGVYGKGPDRQAFRVADGALTTGRYPASSEPAARALPARLVTRWVTHTASNRP